MTNDSEQQQKKEVGVPGGNSALDKPLQCDTDSPSEDKEETLNDINIQMVMRKVQMFFTEPPIAIIIIFLIDMDFFI